MSNTMVQTLSLIGAFMVLYAYIASVMNRMDSKGFAYGFLNCAGTALIAVTALFPLNIGVLLLESIWSVVSFFLCVRALKARKTSPV